MALITATQVIDTAFTNKNTDTYLVKPAFIEIAELNFIKPALGEDLYNLITEEKDTSVPWTSVEACTYTAGTTTITIDAASTFIQVGDFVTGTGIPQRKDGDSQEKTEVLTVNTAGAVTSITISATITVDATGGNLTFSRPNGYLANNYIIDYLAFCVKFEMLPDMSYNTTSQGLVENVADYTMPVDSKKLSFLRNETYKKSDAYLGKMMDFICDNEKSYPKYCNENKGGVSKKNGIIIY
tara:strand:+ start:119 stop:838 length:720 start_codon:yes stop_codon:yes gene_type:complete